MDGDYNPMHVLYDKQNPTTAICFVCPFYNLNFHQITDPLNQSRFGK